MKNIHGHEPLTIVDGLSSALDLCDKKLRLSISIEKSKLTVPIFTLKRFTLRDNNNRTYEVEFTGFKKYHYKFKNQIKSKQFPNEYHEFDYTYITGIMKCTNF